MLPLAGGHGRPRADGDHRLLALVRHAAPLLQDLDGVHGPQYEQALGMSLYSIDEPCLFGLFKLFTLTKRANAGIGLIFTSSTPDPDSAEAELYNRSGTR